MNEPPKHFEAQSATVRELGREDRTIEMPAEECPHPTAEVRLSRPVLNTESVELPEGPLLRAICGRCSAVLR